MDLQALRTLDLFKNLDAIHLAHLASIIEPFPNTSRGYGDRVCEVTSGATSFDWRTNLTTSSKMMLAWSWVIEAVTTRYLPEVSYLSGRGR